MTRRTPVSSRTDTLVPYPSLFLSWPAKTASATQYPPFFHRGYELTGERGKRPPRLKHHGLARSLLSHIPDIGLADQFPLRFERAMQFQRSFAMQYLLPIQPCTRVHSPEPWRSQHQRHGWKRFYLAFIQQTQFIYVPQSCA